MHCQQFCAFNGHDIAAIYHDIQTASGRVERSGFSKAGLTNLLELQKQGKQLVILDLNLDTSTAIGQCMITVMFAIAELERNTINERCRSGKSKIREKDGYVHGRPPYGWKAVNVNGKRDLVAIPEEQKWRKQIQEWRRCGLTYRMIADELNLLGVKPQIGAQWGQPSVRQICIRKYQLVEWLEGRAERDKQKQSETTRRAFYGNTL